MRAFRPYIPIVTAANRAATTNALENCRRHNINTTRGATSGACVTFEYVAIPRRVAATPSDDTPRKSAARGTVSSLYNQTKYATKTTAKLNRSDVKNTAYTGTTAAP